MDPLELEKQTVVPCRCNVTHVLWKEQQMVITTEPSPQALDKGFSLSFLFSFCLFVCFRGFVVVVVKMDLHDSNIGKVQKDQACCSSKFLLDFHSDISASPCGILQSPEWASHADSS